MADIWKGYLFSNAFSWMKIILFSLKCHWSLLLNGNGEIHYLNQSQSSLLTHICVTKVHSLTTLPFQFLLWKYNLKSSLLPNTEQLNIDAQHFLCISWKCNLKIMCDVVSHICLQQIWLTTSNMMLDCFFLEGILDLSVICILEKSV